MIDIFKPKRATSILGLSLEGNRLEAVVLRRQNGSLQVLQTLATPLALSPLSGDPELVGREIRNHLDQAGIRERRCAVCLPLNWVLSVQAQIPEMPEEDVSDFLQIEAERGFHSGHENLSLATSRAKSVSGEQYATLLGIPHNHIATLERALKAAQLKPLTFSLGITALAGAARSTGGMLTLALAGHTIDLEVSGGGGIAALRSIDAAQDSDAAQKTMDADLVAREIRITLGQLPAGFRKDVNSARIFTRTESERQFSAEVSRRLETMSLRTELMNRASDATFTQPPPPAIVNSPALALAANYLRNQEAGPEFLPPKVHPLQQFINSKFSSGKLVWAGGAAGAVALIVILAFLFQQYQISSLQNRWKTIEPTVNRVTDARDQIQKFRPWFDNSFPALRILKTVTEAFPEDGYVTAKTLEIRDLTSITCSGTARDNKSYLDLLDKLRKSDQIVQLKTESVRGQSPIQFTFNFQWQEGGAPGGN